MGSRLLFIDEQKTGRGKRRSGCEGEQGLRRMGEGVVGFLGTGMGWKGVGGGEDGGVGE